jgi:hypothetical protein
LRFDWMLSEYAGSQSRSSSRPGRSYFPQRRFGPTCE